MIEAEDDAGGLCRSREVDGYPLDIGGGHFLDTKRPEVNKFLFDFMPEREWNLFERDSRISINGREISHPFESNIWQFEIDQQIEYLKSIAYAGCNIGKPMPAGFVEWISWKLGYKIANDYMMPYNRKMFGQNLNDLGTYWLDKLPNVSLEDTLRACLSKKAVGTQPGHAIFYYPKNYGYGEVWRRIAERISEHILYGVKICGINFESNSVVSRSGRTYSADKIITTIPWNEFENIEGASVSLVNDIRELKHTSVCIEYYGEDLKTSAHWIYYPDENLSYHRILVRNSFCKGKGYWTETNTDRVGMSKKQGKYRYTNIYAYPLNTKNKRENMKRILDYSELHHIYGLGRWGEHQHYNSDVVVERALTLADKFAKT